LGSTAGLDDDRSNPNNERAVDAAGEFVREHHSWRRRGEQVFNHLANGAAIDLRSMQSEPRLGRLCRPRRVAARFAAGIEGNRAIWLSRAPSHRMRWPRIASAECEIGSFLIAHQAVLRLPDQ
jgi:hypothetical protein